MPCVPDGYSYGGVDRPEFPWENWAGTVGRQDPSTCWIRRRWPATLPDDLHASLGPNPLCGGGVADAILIAAAAALDAEAMVLALIPVVGIIWSVEVSQRADGLRARAGET